MRYYLLLFAYLLLYSDATAQYAHAASDQLAPSNQTSRKTISGVLLFGGIALIVGGVVSYASEKNTSYYPGKAVGTGLMIGGAAAVITGIALRNADRRTASTKIIGLKMEQTNFTNYVSTGRGKMRTAFPAIAFHIPFNARK